MPVTNSPAGSVFPPLLARFRELGALCSSYLIDEFIADGRCSLADAAETCRARAEQLETTAATSRAWEGYRRIWRREAAEFRELADRLDAATAMPEAAE